MHSTVLLHHALPDGTSHIDWMLAPDADAKLVTFRLDAPVHELREGETLRAERIGDHRRFYLDHEGPLPGTTDRGSVRCVVRGAILRWDRQTPRSWSMAIRWESGAENSYELVSECDEDPWWLVRAVFAAVGGGGV